MIRMKYSLLVSDHICRPVVAILAVLVVLQWIFSRHVYDVTIYTYRVMQAYYMKESNSLSLFPVNGSLNFSESEEAASALSLDAMTAAGNTSLGRPRADAAAAMQSSTQGSSILKRLRLIGNEIMGRVEASAVIGQMEKVNQSSPENETCNPVLASTFGYDGVSDPFKFKTAQGGEWTPRDCLPRASVALIVPFRQRHSHLNAFIPYMHAFLQKQQLHYRIYIIEQYDNGSFNRAKLMNVGFREAAKSHKFDCYVFHDVDLLPLDERIGYNCSPQGPVHLAAAMDKFGFAMPYSGFFGGACAFTEKQLKKMNGFSNKFAGWGGEDDDIDARVKFSGQEAQRYPVQVARYRMIKHGPDKGNEANPQRYKLLEESKTSWRMDGLNSLKYAVVNVTETALYTKITVEVA